MTGFRFNQLKAGAQPIDDAEIAEYKNLLVWEKRSSAAKQAVKTKRRKYATWPTRKNDHR